MRKQLLKILEKSYLPSFVVSFVYFFWGCRIKASKKNVFSFNYSTLINCARKCLGTSNSLTVSKDSFIENSSVTIHGCDNLIVIGKDVYINHLEIIIEGNNNSVFIGNGFFVCGNTRLYVVDGSSLRIGDQCMLSDNIEIRTTDNHGIYDLSSGERINEEKDINIGNHVWIGMGATVLKGVNIADGCIVGAKSLITHSIEQENCCVVGDNRIIKHNVCWTMERKERFSRIV